MLVAVLAWLAGLVAYIAALALLYGQWMSRGDFTSIIIASLVAFALCFWLVYLPALRAARRVLGKRPAFVFPVIAMLLGIIPTALIARVWGGSYASLYTPEAVLFSIMFAAVGLVVGIGFARLPENTTS